MAISELDYLVPAGLISVHEMCEQIVGRKYGSAHLAGAGVYADDAGNIQIVRRSAADFSDSLDAFGDARSILVAAVAGGALLLRFADGMRPPSFYWQTGAGLEALERGVVVARGSPQLQAYDGQALFADRAEFVLWLSQITPLPAPIVPARRSDGEGPGDEHPRQEKRVRETENRDARLKQRAVEVMRRERAGGRLRFTKEIIANKIRGEFNLSLPNAMRLLKGYKDLRTEARKPAPESTKGEKAS
jgi:hypothetical protein